MAAEHTIAVPVHWSDADPAGIVFYPRFFEWYDRGAEELFAACGLPWPETFPRYHIVGVPIVEAGSRFMSPVRYGEVVTLHTAIAWVREKTFRLEHAIAVGDRPCARGFEVRAWVSAPRAAGAPLHAVSIPAEVAARLRGEP